MLGLGDIVIPGMFIALALRYDHHQASRCSSGKEGVDKFKKPYFYAAIIAYALGLGMTMSVMHFFKAAQPALLYLRYVGFIRRLWWYLSRLTCVLLFLFF